MVVARQILLFHRIGDLALDLAVRFARRPQPPDLVLHVLPLSGFQCVRQVGVDRPVLVPGQQTVGLLVDGPGHKVDHPCPLFRVSFHTLPDAQGLVHFPHKLLCQLLALAVFSLVPGLCSLLHLRAVFLQPVLQLAGNGLFVLAHGFQLRHSTAGVVRVPLGNGVVQPVILPGGARRGRAERKAASACNASCIFHIGIKGIQHFPGVPHRHTRNFKPVLHQVHACLSQFLVIRFQLFLRHVTGVLPDKAGKLRYCCKKVIHSADVGCTHHIVIRTVHCISHSAVQLAAIQEVARKAFRVQIQESLAHAGRGHISVLVLLSVPPVQQEVRTDLHQCKHSSLGDLAHNGPVQVLSSPLHFFCCLAAVCSLVSCFLGVVVHHRIGQNAVVLETLGREHGQGLGHLIRISLDPRPLHRGVVGLGLLNDPLIHLVHGFPVGFAAFCGCTLCKLIGMVLHIPLGALPQGRYRDLVHAVDPAGHPLGQLVHGLFCRALAHANAGKLTPLAAPQSVSQQHIPVLGNFLFQRCPLLAGEVLHKRHHRRHGIRTQHSTGGRQGCRLGNGHTRVQRQDRARIVAAQPVQHFGHCGRALSLRGLQVGQ